MNVRPNALPLLAIAALVLSTPAYAQGNATAEAIFEEGLRLFDAKDYTNACKKFEASQRLDPAAGTLLNLARSYEAAGRTASAWSAYGEAAAFARRERDPKREKVARDREEALAPTLARLKLIAPRTTNAKILRDGTVMDEAALGIAIPVDPGSHTIVAAAPGKKTWATEIVVNAGESKSLNVPELAGEATSTSSAGVPIQKTIAIVAGGVGIVALGAGSFFGWRAVSLKSDAKPHCFGDGTCDADGVRATDQAAASADLATGFLIAGGVALVTGVVLFFTAPKGSSVVQVQGQGPRLTF